MPRYKRPHNIYGDRDKHGKQRIYDNLPGSKKIPLPGPFYSDAFIVAYQKAVEGEAQQTARVGTSRLVPCSFGDLLRRYYTAPEFLNLAPATQRNYRRILERFAEKCRDLPVAADRKSVV